MVGTNDDTGVQMHEHRVLWIREAGHLYEAIVDDDLGLRTFARR